MAYRPVTTKAKCEVEGCQNMTIGEKCTMHRALVAKVTKRCATPDCEGRVRSKEYCVECTRKQNRNPLNNCAAPGCMRRCHGDICAICVNKQVAEERRLAKQIEREAAEKAGERIIIDGLIAELEAYGYKVDKINKIISALNNTTK